MNEGVNKYLMDVIGASANWLLPAMTVAFFFSVIARFLVFYTVRSENRFSKEFEKRVQKYLADPEAPRVSSFHRLVRQLLEQTFHEAFELKNKYKRRNLDHLSSVTDRMFLIQDGAWRVVDDTLKRTRYLRKEAPPRLVELSKSVFDVNPVFNRVLGIFPIGTFNDLLSIMPGLFIICGILGTFMGIMKSLPELGGMDMANIEETKKVMDMFLLKISHSMLTSVGGIALSVSMSLLNTMFSVEGHYFGLINSFSSSLECLWNETTNNEVDRDPSHSGGGGSGLPPGVSRQHSSSSRGAA